MSNVDEIDDDDDDDEKIVGNIDMEFEYTDGEEEKDDDKNDDDDNVEDVEIIEEIKSNQKDNKMREIITLSDDDDEVSVSDEDNKDEPIRNHWDFMVIKSADRIDTG